MQAFPRFERKIYWLTSAIRYILNRAQERRLRMTPKANVADIAAYIKRDMFTRGVFYPDFMPPSYEEACYEFGPSAEFRSIMAQCMILLPMEVDQYSDRGQAMLARCLRDLSPKAHATMLLHDSCLDMVDNPTTRDLNPSARAAIIRASFYLASQAARRWYLSQFLSQDFSIYLVEHQIYHD